MRLGVKGLMMNLVTRKCRSKLVIVHLSVAEQSVISLDESLKLLE